MGQFLLRSIQNWLSRCPNINSLTRSFGIGRRVGTAHRTNFVAHRTNFVAHRTNFVAHRQILCFARSSSSVGRAHPTQFPDYFPIGCIKFLGPW
jgi:hypothetical protein